MTGSDATATTRELVLLADDEPVSREFMAEVLRAQQFEVVDGAAYHKRELDRERIFMRNGPPVLTLITCGGDFNPSIRRYDSNVVVYAVPITVTEEDPT